MKKNFTTGSLVIGLFEIFWGMIGTLFLLLAFIQIYGLYEVPRIIQDVSTYKYKVAVMGKLSLFWALPYFCMLLVGVGMFLRREWSRKLTLRIIPFVMLISFPLFFTDYYVVVKKIKIMYDFSNILEVNGSFWPMFFKCTRPWLVYIASILFFNIVLRRYLTLSGIKETFK